MKEIGSVISEKARTKLYFAEQDGGKGGVLWAKMAMCMSCGLSGSFHTIHTFYCELGLVYQAECLLKGFCTRVRKYQGAPKDIAVLPEEYRLDDIAAARLRAIIEEGKTAFQEEGKTAFQEEENKLISR